MNRSLKLSMLIALALGSTQLMALDLGQVQVKSALGQPLLAEIPLHPANAAELQNLTVQLASSEDFARAGIVGGRTAIPLHFSVAGTASGHPVIRITSSVAVDNPYLDLLIEVNGKAGRSVREFAILLDPPGSQTAAAAPAAAPSHKASRAAAATAAPRPAAAASRPAATATRPATTDGQYGPIQRGQTLSGVAQATAPAGVDVRQMLLALKQANPDAFYRDNINALKTGAVLRVPTAAEAQTMTIAAAMAEVRRENSDWRAGTPGKPTVVADTATRASASSAPNNTASDSGDRLALVPAKEGHGAGSQGDGKGDKSAAAIRQDLLRTQESLASLQQQSSDLKTRLKDLTDINSKNEHLLSLKDSEIAALQAKLAAARKADGLSATPTSSTSAAAPLATATSSAPSPALVQTGSVPATAGSAADANAAPAMAGSTETTAMPATPASAAAAPPAVAPAPTAAKSPTTKPPVVTPGPAAAFEQPWYMQPWTWAAGAGAIVLLILLAMLGRRRKPATSASKSSSLADRFGSEPSAEQDLIGGTDVDQEELLDQLAEHPDDIDLHLELVTLYYSRRDVEHFEAAAEAMHAHITDPQQDEWQDVLHMGEDLVPAHPLFDHHPEPELPVYEENEARREFDIDDYADDSDAPTVVSTLPGPPPMPKKVSEYNFNFDLSTPASSEAAVDHAAASDETVVAPRTTETLNEAPSEATSNWDFDAAENTSSLVDQNGNPDEFNDDPIDTKLDLARAYLDMGDADGARSMLGEVMKEGSQMQQDTARRLLENLH